jgi:carbon monoxide dehydrogenase subunit G
MEMNNTRIVAAPTEQVWRALNDPDVLKDCVPGCESLERVTDTEWRAVVAARVGPVSARFTGKLALADLNPPTSYTLRFEGQGGPRVSSAAMRRCRSRRPRPALQRLRT